jgi:FkbM family methyltransferase
MQANLRAEFYSQIGQDRYLHEHIFKGKRNGVFVDIGAHDGISFSNTYFFEKELGWTGICVEPHPDCFAKLKQNRTCSCWGVCAGNVEGMVNFLKIDGYAQMLSGVYAAYDQKHLARIEAELAHYGGKAQIIPIAMHTMSSILHQEGITYVDFLSLDVEGAELAVLQGIDFTQCSIQYILVERNYKESFEPIEQLLASQGYVNVHSFDFDELFELKSL